MQNFQEHNSSIQQRDFPHNFLTLSSECISDPLTTAKEYWDCNKPSRLLNGASQLVTAVICDTRVAPYDWIKTYARSEVQSTIILMEVRKLRGAEPEEWKQFLFGVKIKWVVLNTSVEVALWWRWQDHFWIISAVYSHYLYFQNTDFEN